MKILVIRFKQIGDAVLSSVICNTLKESFKDSQVDYVVYDHIVPLFEKHPFIDNVISITNEERKNPFKYLKKVWDITRTDYDIVIDIMSTPKSELFTLLSRKAKYRIGRWKPKRGYTYTHSIKEPKDAKDKVDKFLKMLKPLEKEYTLTYNNDYRVGTTKEEIDDMRQVMIDKGVDFSRPVLAFAINSRRTHKIWKQEYIIEVMNHTIKKYNGQIVLFYSPEEKAYAKETHALMGNTKDVFSNIETRSIRDLGALLGNCDFFAGNEGGPRHISQALSVPSLALFSNGADKKEWLSNKSERYQGIEAKDFGFDDFLQIKPKYVIEKLDEMLDIYLKRDNLGKSRL